MPMQPSPIAETSKLLFPSLRFFIFRIPASLIAFLCRRQPSRTLAAPSFAEVGDVECLAGGKASAERLIEESFRFLLERESNTSILRSFRITDIGRYFPEYELEIRRRLAR